MNRATIQASNFKEKLERLDLKENEVTIFSLDIDVMFPSIEITGDKKDS